MHRAHHAGPQAETTLGTVAGAASADGRVRVFKGMPYAAPPVGPNRWRPPQPAQPWAGLRPALAFGPDCPQGGKTASNAPSKDEDCLYLNVWAPANASGPLPVMVWLHGGGFVAGSGADRRCDGEALARRGVVVVTFNYRVGLFGFLAHPELSRESSRGVSGNYGLLDQLAALRWVRENIAAFGGDPSRTTVFGVSAGSACISLMLASPQARGLFQRAILHSPGAGRPLASLAQAEEAGRALGDDLAALRELSADDVLARTALLVPKMRGLTTPRVLRPIRDGWTIVEDERPAFLAGRMNAMPVMLGSNADEGTRLTASWTIHTQAAYRTMLGANFPGASERAEAIYAAADDGEVAGRVAEVFADCQFNYGVRLLARAMARLGQPTWRYVFLRRRAGTPDGPHHGDEVAYVFGSVAAARAGQPAADEIDRAVSDAMMTAWVNFAASADPNPVGSVPWPAYRADDDRHLAFGDIISEGAGWRRAPLDFLDAYFEKAPG